MGATGDDFWMASFSALWLGSFVGTSANSKGIEACASVVRHGIPMGIPPSAAMVRDVAPREGGFPLSFDDVKQ